jgi:hypothetical protein
MFMDLILWGIVWDRAAGDLMFVPPPVEWNLFVELSVPPEGDKGFPVTHMEDVLRKLPSLTHAASRVVQESATPFAIEETARLVATCIKCHHAGSSGSIKAFFKATRQLILEENATPLIAELLAGFSCSRVAQKRALNLLGERCRWLLAYCSFLSDFHDAQFAGALSPSDIIELFIEEAKQASQAPIRTSPLYTCCAAPQGSVPTLCILNFDPARKKKFA